MPAETPAAVTTLPASTNRASPTTSTLRVTPLERLDAAPVSRRSLAVEQSALGQQLRSRAHAGCEFDLCRLGCDPVQHPLVAGIDHVRASTAGNDEDVERGVIFDGVVRLHQEPTPAPHGLILFRDGDHVEESLGVIQTVAAARDREDLERAAEVEHLDFRENQDPNGAWRCSAWNRS